MERRSNEPDTEAAWLNFDPATYIGPIAQDRLGNFINGSPGTGNSPGATSTPTFTPSPTLTSTVTQTPTITPTRTATGTPTQTLTPAASMSVIINEVAWMGTSASTSDEWIELYNPSATNSINLSGWRLETTESGTKSLSFTFTDCTAPKNCIIPPQGYLLLERTDDATVSDIAADQFFTGSLPNSGSYQSLRLYSNTNQLMDKANSNGGNWPAGSATTYCTMERRGSAITDSDSAWITNTGLLKNGLDASGNAVWGNPKNINWAYYVTPTPTPAKTSTPIRTPTKSRTPPPNPSTPEPVVIN